MSDKTREDVEILGVNHTLAIDPDSLNEAGVDLPEFVQDNHSLSRQAGTVRGLHYQSPPHAQANCPLPTLPSCDS